jgi:hypothetical protein
VLEVSVTLLNLMPEVLALAPARGAPPSTWSLLPSAGHARVRGAPLVHEHVPGCPVPIVGAPGPADIEGLPEAVWPGLLLVVEGPVAQRAALARETLEHELLRLEDGLADGALWRHHPAYEQALPALARRLDVLSRVVAPGLSPEDEPICWTEADAERGLCCPARVGAPRAVTRLRRS